MSGELGIRVGMKVEWRYYATRAEAEAAAEKAIVEAERRAAQGYDFGYQCPGTIRKVTDPGQLEPELSGLGPCYEVVFP